MICSIIVGKRLGILAVMGLLMVSTVMAQGGRRMSAEEAKEAFETNFAEMIVSLELSEEVAPDVKSVLWSQQEKMMELRASMQGGGGNSLARSGMREKMGEINSETMEALALLLTSDQMEKYVEIQSSRRGGQGRGRGQGQQRRPPQ